MCGNRFESVIYSQGAAGDPGDPGENVSTCSNFRGRTASTAIRFISTIIYASLKDSFTFIVQGMRGPPGLKGVKGEAGVGMSGPPGQPGPNGLKVFDSLYCYRTVANRPLSVNCGT